MKRLGLLLALCSVVALHERPSAMIPEQVRIDTGSLAGVVGATQPTVRVFKGIPFAAPPLGENRWKPPQPAAKWDGVFKADAFGARARPVAAAGEAAAQRPDAAARRRAGCARGRGGGSAGPTRASSTSSAPEAASRQRGLPDRERLDERERRPTIDGP